MLATARKTLNKNQKLNLYKIKIKNQTKKQNKRKYFCCFEFISESKRSNKSQIKSLIRLKKVKPRHIKTIIVQVNTIHIMWMGNIEYERDNLMLVDE